MEKKQLLLTIVTPEKTVIADKPVEAVTIPAFGGEMGVLPGHASFVVQLMEGILHYRDGHYKEVFAVLNGFAEIHKAPIPHFSDMIWSELFTSRASLGGLAES